MLPILVFAGLGWLAWWLTRYIASFPEEFALLLDDSEVQRGPLSLFTGRSSVTGTFQGRSVTLHFQRANENQTGYARVSMWAVAPGVDADLAGARSRLGTGGPELNAALSALEGTHELRVGSVGGWVRATWQPTGFFIFPGRFDPAKWQDVLRHLLTVTSQLEARTTPSTEMTPALAATLSRTVAREDGVDSTLVPATPTRIVSSRAGRTGTLVASPPHSRERQDFGGPILIFKLIAGAMILASLSMLTASAGIGFAIERSGRFALATGGFAVIVLVASVGTFVLAAWPTGLLINERAWERGESEESMPLGSWLWLLLLTLNALPVWMAARLSPLTTLWRDIFRFLDENGIWEMAQESSDLSGLVMFPVLGVLSVPALELAVALGVVIGALGLMVLLLVRSPRFPRAFLLSVLLLAGLVASAQWAAHAVTTLTTDFLPSQFFNRPGDEQVQAALARYADVTQSAANVLTVVIVGWLAWTPTLFHSRRVRATFRR